MVRYIRAHMVWLYILRSNGNGWGTAYDIANEETRAAFTELLKVAYPLAFDE